MKKIFIVFKSLMFAVISSVFVLYSIKFFFNSLDLIIEGAGSAFIGILITILFAVSTLVFMEILEKEE